MYQKLGVEMNPSLGAHRETPMGERAPQQMAAFRFSSMSSVWGWAICSGRGNGNVNPPPNHPECCSLLETWPTWAFGTCSPLLAQL